MRKLRNKEFYKKAKMIKSKNHNFGEVALRDFEESRR